MALSSRLPKPAPQREQPREEEARPLEWGELYRDYSRQVSLWAARLGSPVEDREDVVQEVFLIVQRQIARFRGDSKVSTWLFSITENVVREKRRKGRFQSWLGGSAADVADHLPSREQGPAEALDASRAHASVYRAVQGVSEKYRSAFLLFEVDGMSGEEISALLDVKIGTLWVWLHRARAQFLKSLKKLESRGGFR